MVKNLQTFFAYDPADSDQRRVEKFATFLVAVACILVGPKGVRRELI